MNSDKQSLYCAIIGDIVKSRKIKDREAFQRKLKTILDHINNEYALNITSRFVITVGDELQGLLKPTKQCCDIIIKIVEEIEPVKIRFGIGFGTVATPIEEIALGMDGPAFYNARKALKDAYRLKDHAVLFSGIEDDTGLIALNTVATLLAQVRNLWSDRQKKVAKLTRARLTQADIAKELGVSQANVSQIYQKGRIEQVLETEQNLEFLLEQYLT